MKKKILSHKLLHLENKKSYRNETKCILKLKILSRGINKKIRKKFSWWCNMENPENPKKSFFASNIIFLKIVMW